MRIAYLAQSYPPMISGAALAVERLAVAMAERGHQVLVIAASDRNRPYTVQHGNLTVMRLKSHHNPMRANQRFLLFPYTATIQALRKFQPDVIHAHEPLQTAWAGFTYAHRNHIPAILTAHQAPSYVASYMPGLPSLGNHIESLLWIYSRWLMKQFDTVVVPSHTISKLVTARTGIPTTSISNGIDLQTFHPLLSCADEVATRGGPNLPLNVPILLHVGRLDADKGVDRVIAAATRAMQHTNAHLLIVGDGCQKNALIQLCLTMGIAKRVHFTGAISDKKYLAEIYRSASLFITASEIETQGLVLLEAAASGLPIVAVNATCIPEIVHDRVNGLLAQPGDILALSDHILTILGNRKGARLLGEEGRILVEEHAIQRGWSLHENLYQGLIHQARASHYSVHNLARLLMDITR